MLKLPNTATACFCIFFGFFRSIVVAVVTQLKMWFLCRFQEGSIWVQCRLVGVICVCVCVVESVLAHWALCCIWDQGFGYVVLIPWCANWVNVMEQWKMYIFVNYAKGGAAAVWACFWAISDLEPKSRCVAVFRLKIGGMFFFPQVFVPHANFFFSFLNILDVAYLNCHALYITHFQPNFVFSFFPTMRIPQR